MGRKSSNAVHNTMALDSAPNVKVYSIGSQNCCLFSRLHECVVDLFQRGHTWNNCKDIYCRSAAITGISTFEIGLLWSQRPVFPSINECLLSSARYIIVDETAFRNSCNPLARVLLSASPALEQWHDYPSGSLNAPTPHKHNSQKRLFIFLENCISMDPLICEKVIFVSSTLKIQTHYHSTHVPQCFGYAHSPMSSEIYFAPSKVYHMYCGEWGPFRAST